MNTDIPLARRDVIAARLATGQAVVAATLALEFAVSEDAIRRDLRALAAEGRCRRVYGGALPLRPGVLPMAARMDEARERKAALARVAARSIRPGEFLFLDSGSTNLALAAFLPEDQDLTVATNSIDIAAAVVRRPDLQLIMVGGTVDPLVGGCVDAAAVMSVSQMNLDRCFLGACAVTSAEGMSATTFADAAFKRALLAASRHCVVMATTDKLDQRAPHRIAPITAVHQLVVEHDAGEPLIQAVVHAGVTVMRAEREAI